MSILDRNGERPVEAKTVYESARDLYGVIPNEEKPARFKEWDELDFPEQDRWQEIADEINESRCRRLESHA